VGFHPRCGSLPETSFAICRLLPVVTSRSPKAFAPKAFVAKAAGFERPIQQPRDDDEHSRWQGANRAWWESAPMRYDWRVDLEERAGTEAYYREIDRRFIEAANGFLPCRQIPFDAVIPFDELADKDVLEIGVGQGTHAQLLAPRCKSFVGIDLTAVAVEMVSTRLRLFNLPGTVLQMDAEHMDFPDNSFDYAWSWGVIHHSADTQRVLAEIHRVLRPGGQCTVMVYYRSWWNYYVSGFLRRALLEPWRSGRSLHQASQRGSDGAIARYYKPHEWRAATKDLFVLDSMQIHGMKSDVVLLPYGRLKQTIMRMLPDACARFLTQRLRMGSFLVARMRKPMPC
jgi:SAM-dependent methyltransferase